MKTEELKETAGERKVIQVSTQAEIPTIYANHANLDISSFDIRLRLGLIQGLQGEAVAVKEVLHVFMSHSHFEAFAKAVNTTLRKMAEIPTTAPVGASTQKTDQKA